MTQQDARHPSCSMTSCSQGSNRTAPTPTPENAMLMARPRRPMNQFGRKSDCAVKPNRLAPAPTNTPSVR